MSQRAREGCIVGLALALFLAAPAQGEHYAVLFAGTPKPAESDDLFFNRITRMYGALTDHLNFLAGSIQILSYDGSHTYDGQALPSATGANLENILTSLTLGPRDTFVFATVAHGSGTYDDDSVTDEEKIAGYDGDHIDDDEFVSWISGIGAGRDAYLFTQCYSGGFLQELDFTDRVRFGCASSTHYESSWYDPLGPQKGFLGWLAKGIEEGDPTDPVDTSLTETESIYTYARDNDPFVTDGEGPDGEPADLRHHPWMRGDDIDLAVAHWLGGSNTNWSNPDNWKAGVLPEHDRTVRIAPGVPAAMSGTTQAVKQLIVQPGGTLELSAGAELYPDDVENEGMLRVSHGFFQAFGDIWNQTPASSAIEVGPAGWVLTEAVHNEGSLSVDGGEFDAYADSDNAGTMAVSNNGLLLMSCDVRHTGLLSVSSGGHAQIVGALEMALPGEVRVSGSDSLLQINGSFQADGQIVADAGGRVETAGHFEAGRNQTSVIRLTDAQLAVTDPASMMFFARDYTTVVEATRSEVAAAAELFIGERSYAKATLRGGSLAAETVYIGYESTGEGWLVLEQDGADTPTVAIGDSSVPMLIGCSGVGTLTQNAGTVTRGDQDGPYPGVVLAYDAEGTGRYELNDGSLHADSLTVGRSGAGTLVQSGGSALVDRDLHIGVNSQSSGVVSLLGGSTTVENVLCGSGNSELNVDGGDLKLNGTSIEVEALNVGESHGSFGRLELTGKTVTADEMTVGGEGDGTYVARSGATSIASQLRVGETHAGRVKQDGGTVTVSRVTLGYWAGASGDYHLAAGALDVTGTILTVGSEGTGSFTQEAGTTVTAQRIRIASSGTSVDCVYDLVGGDLVATTETTIGYSPGAEGLLKVRDGTLQTPELYVGDYGQGRLAQEGGLVDVATALYVGRSGSGSYELAGGTLRTQQTVLGEYSDTCRGAFEQTGGTHEATGDVYLGMAGNQSSYSLDGEGSLLSCANLYVGHQTMASFAQSGGVALATQDIHVGHGSGGYGVYSLSGGSLSARGFVFVGSTSGTGLLQLGGGTLSCDAGWLGVSSGSSVSGFGIVQAAVSSFGHLRVEGGTLTVEGACNSYGAASIEPGAALQLKANSAFDGSLSNDGRLEVLTGRTHLNGGVTGGGDLSVAVGGELELACNLGGLEMTVAGAALHGSGTATLSGAVDVSTGGQYLLQDSGRVVPGPVLTFDPPTTLSTAGTHVDGQFLHQGGTHASDELYIGGAAGATYEMGLGTLSAGELHVGISFSDGDAPGTLRFLDPAARIEVSVALVIHPQGMLDAAPGTVIHMTGSTFENHCADPAAEDDFVELAMVFEGGPGDLDPFEVAGRDLGADPIAFGGNYALGALIIGGDDIGRLQLVNHVDNCLDWGGPEALYVDVLKVASGCELDLNGMNLYYRQGHVPDDAILITGGGSLVQVPEPATLCLLAVVAGLRRRRRI